MSSQPIAVAQESRDNTLRIVIFVLGLWNMVSWLIYATSSWSTEGED